MGVIFNGQSQKFKVGELLGTNKEWILNRLQAGRVKTGTFGSSPYRLSKEELEKLKDEYIYVQIEDDCVYATFEKSTNEIRTLLGLPIQSDNPFDLF